MKKFYAALFIIFIFPILFWFPSFASNNIESNLNDYYGVNLTFNDNAYQTLLNAQELATGKLLLYRFNGYWNIVVSRSSGNISTRSDGSYQWSSATLISGDLNRIYTPELNSSGNNYLVGTDNILFNSYSEFMEQFDSLPIDFETLYYSPNIPVPDMNVYYILSSNLSSQTFWNAEMTIADNNDFYIQYGIKLTVPTLVGIGLDSSTGDYTYSYDQYSTGSYIDIKSLEELTPCINISLGSSDMLSFWNDAYEILIDSDIPEFYSKVPFWTQNPNAAKFISAQNYYKTNMMNQMPMFGNRLEIFARFFTIDEENRVIVGNWLHWSSRTGSRTQEKPSNYIDQMELPGYINQTNNTDFESQEDTYQTTGNTTGASTIINNNYAPNYPDYPTIASYNKDNLLLETMGYMGNMNNFLSGPNGFGHFLTEVFTFIPSYVWGMVAMGFGVAIIVMFIKML